MHSGCFLVPNVPYVRGLDSQRTREFPFGQPIEGEKRILYVCLNMTHRDRVSWVFKDKAMYILWSMAITGRVFDTIAIFKPFLHEFDRPTQAQWWKAVDNIHTRLTKGGEVVWYDEDQQRELGI